MVKKKKNVTEWIAQQAANAETNGFKDITEKRENKKAVEISRLNEEVSQEKI